MTEYYSQLLMICKLVWTVGNASGIWKSVRPIYTPIKSLLSYDMFGTRQHPIVYVREN